MGLTGKLGRAEITRGFPFRGFREKTAAGAWSAQVNGLEAGEGRHARPDERKSVAVERVAVGVAQGLVEACSISMPATQAIMVEAICPKLRREAEASSL
jgi:hypothetical protein